MSDFSASAGILSGPTAFTHFICLIAILISSIVGGVSFMGRFVCAASISSKFSGADPLESSCSVVFEFQ